MSISEVWIFIYLFTIISISLPMHIVSIKVAPVRGAQRLGLDITFLMTICREWRRGAPPSRRDIFRGAPSDYSGAARKLRDSPPDGAFCFQLVYRGDSR